LALYAAAQVIISPIAGVLSDKISTRQLPFLVGLLALFGATLLLSVGQTIPVLAIARMLQGTSAAIVWTVGLTICLETVGPANLGTTIGSIFSFISAGTLAAPVLGGVLYKKTGYVGVFGLGASFLVVDFGLRLMVIEKKIAVQYKDHPEHCDSNSDTSSIASKNSDAEAGDDAADSAPGEDSPLLGISSSNHYRITTKLPRLLASMPVLACVTDSSLLVSFLTAFMQALLLAAFDSTIPTFARDAYGFDSLKDGLLFIPLGVADLVVGPLAGWATDRLGVKPVTTFGFVLLTPVLVLLRLPQPGGVKQVVLYGCLIALAGAGSSIISSGSIVESGAVVEKYYKANKEFFGHKEPYAQLYGINAMMFSGGLTLGPLIAGGLKDSIGYGNMNAVLGAVCGVTAVLCYVFLGGRPRWLQRKL